MRSVFLAILFVVMPFHLYASDQEAEVVNPTLNVRSGPGIKHKVVATVKKGDRFPVLKVEKQWLQIEIDAGTLEKLRSKKGDKEVEPWKGETWVYRKYVRFVGRGPDFEERQIDFQNWALDAIPVIYIEFKSDWQIWVRLPADKYASRSSVRKIAQQMAAEYKKQTGLMGEEVVVKVLRGEKVYTTVSE
jgi:hypothetical protein